MPHDQAYLEAEKKIEEALKLGATEFEFVNMGLTELPESIGQLAQLQSLNLMMNDLHTLPDSLGNLSQLRELKISHNNRIGNIPSFVRRFRELRILWITDNNISAIPDWIGELQWLEELNIAGNNIESIPIAFSELTNLRTLYFGWTSGNPLRQLPTFLKQLTNLETFGLTDCELELLPEWISKLDNLKELWIGKNNFSDIPDWLANLTNLEKLQLNDNPLNPELAEAYEQGFDGVKTYLRAKSEAHITLNEAKLILVGEGEVGKTCLMDALVGKEWREHPSTHGIEIQQIKVANPKTKKEITLNGWDFGGQRVYRPTHQLFFSAPAVYLVVWKPREGPQQGFVREWIQLIKRREPSAKIIVVATHGGPQQRQPDIDRQELWDLFGKDTIVDFFFVDSKPDENGVRKGIEELKLVIARTAAELPEVGRSVPKSFQGVRKSLQQKNAPYIPRDEVIAICREHKMDDEIADLFIRISHRLGYLTHYENDPTLHDIVILRPDWLSSAMSYILDDEQTRHANGLIDFSRLSLLWNNPARPIETRYPEKLHRIFLRLMERFDLSYRVAGLSPNEETNPVSLIAQLVPDNTPEEKVFQMAWLPEIVSGDIQQTQICRIVDEKGNTANAEGLFFQLIVRLHKFSLGRMHYDHSMHWQRGLVLDDEYNGRALLRHVGNDVHITVRAPYPEFFLAMLTREIKYLVESFWEGLRCDVMVPCIQPCGRQEAGTGLFEVEKLIGSKRKGRPEFPCPVCNEWQNIDSLLLNAPAAQPNVTALIFAEFSEVKAELAKARGQITYLGEKTMGRFDRLDDRTRRTLSRVDKTYSDLLQVLTDEAKDGPRLFSLVPVERSNFNPREWIRAKFKLTLWCEHSSQPLNSPDLDGPQSTKGVYEFELEREWFKKVAPYLKFVMGTLSLVLPVASARLKLNLDDASYEAIEEQLDFGKSVVDAAIGEFTPIGEFFGETESTNIQPREEAIRAQGAMLREFHSLLKSADKAESFGGLVKVLNKHKEFMWVHEKYADQY